MCLRNYSLEFIAALVLKFIQKLSERVTSVCKESFRVIQHQFPLGTNLIGREAGRRVFLINEEFKKKSFMCKSTKYCCTYGNGIIIVHLHSDFMFRS